MISLLLVVVLLLSILDIISLVNAVQGIYREITFIIWLSSSLGQIYQQGSWSFAQILRIPEAGSTYGDTPPFKGTFI